MLIPLNEESVPKQNATGEGGISNLFFLGFEVLPFKILVSLVVFSVDLDNSVFVRLRIFGFLWIWIIGIVKLYTRRPFCNLRSPNRPKMTLNR